MDKQIEEMAQVIEPIIKGFYVTCTNGECETCMVKRWTGKCHAETKSVSVAEALYNANYRKESETAEKFAEKAKEMAYQSTDWSHGEHPMVVEVDDIDEICKEITEGKDG